MWKIQSRTRGDRNDAWEDVGFNVIGLDRKVRSSVPEFPTTEAAERAKRAWEEFAELCGVGDQVEHRVVSVEIFAVEEVSP
jgi:hypothetical protein